MIPILLLAQSFIRQNRWLLLAFVLWPFLLGAFVWSPHHGAARDDVSAIMQQELFYGVVVVAFLASSAIYNEKRSRRIIGVLAKAVSRAQYLLGILLGAACFAVVYFAATGLSLIWLLGPASPLMSAAISLEIRGVATSVWMASIALFFSTFLLPFIAAALAGVVAFAHLAVSHTNVAFAQVSNPLGNTASLSVDLNWEAILLVLMESAIFLILGSIIFVRSDVTVSVE